MRLARILLWVGVASGLTQPASARSGMLLKASLTGHSMILEGVYLNAEGPFRMLVDTGNSSSIVRPATARRLHLAPVYMVEQATVSQTRRLPVAILDEVRVGPAVDRLVEAMVGEVCLTGVDGVLGSNWLVRHDYLLDYRNRQIVLDLEPEEPGVRAPLRSTDGRPVVVASIDGESREFVLDSGASGIVLFEKPASGGAAVQLEANGGSISAQRYTARFSLPGGSEHLIETARVDVRGLGPGLLPASAFAWVFVSNRHGFVAFSR